MPITHRLWNFEYRTISCADEQHAAGCEGGFLEPVEFGCASNVGTIHALAICGSGIHSLRDSDQSRSTNAKFGKEMMRLDPLPAISIIALTLQSISLHSASMVTDVERLMSSYPKIYLACHRRHVRDNESGALLTVQQAGILDHLLDPSPMTVSRLARHLGVTDSTASTAVARLERSGYVVRRRDAVDKRRVWLTLALAGKRIVQDNSVLDPDDVNEMLRLLSSSERKKTLDALDLLARAARELVRRREQGRRKEKT